ncbi:MAG TPA: TatD family hydrolase [Pelagibacteraceae bacterium]|nr:TatD family hydrolase [Pelagibacteraceae bacterium]|tara:strand:- start:388 stop:1158 length:771 start_codon:yes stop_codon:yes gene_type:complete
MIDSHCHLDHSMLHEKLNEVVNRAQLIGVKFLLTISTSLKSFETVKTIISKYENIYGTLGIHPHETKKHIEVDKKMLLKLKGKNAKIIGIGETGLDYYYQNSDKLIQQEKFIEHIETAIDLDIPIIVHSREAEMDTFNILKDFSSKNPKILMHCFTGSLNLSKKFLDLGSYISLSGIITFKNSIELQKTASSVPLDRLLIETDSPYLAPEPKRGLTNEPAFIKHTVQKLALIKNIPYNDLIVYTSNNFIKLFSLNL